MTSAQTPSAPLDFLSVARGTTALRSHPAAGVDLRCQPAEDDLKAETKAEASREKTMLSVFLGSLYIFVQAFLLLFSAAGWAHWIWRVPVVRRHSGDRFFWAFLLAAGFCVGILGLQNLFYLGFRLRITGWFAFAAAALGNAGWVLAWRRDRALPRRVLSGLWQAGTVCLLVFLLQGSALFYWGPSNYYGGGSIDQVNYVMVAQFIADYPDAFHARRGDPGLEPYGSMAVRFLNQRMGQSVGFSYLAIVANCNAKRTYGVFSVLVLSFGAAAVCIFIQALGVPVGAAMLAGCWWGLLPGMTKMHLSGFLSQSCYAWSLPLSAALFILHRRKLDGSYLAFQSIYYGYVMSVYPEVFIVSVAISSGALLFAARALYPRRALALVLPPVCGLFFVGWYLTLFVETLATQYHSASSDVAILSVLVPRSGTWLGWSEIFFGLYPLAPFVQRAVILLGMGLAAVMVLGLLSTRKSRRRLLLGVCLVPVVVLAVLASAPLFPKYAFAKLLVTFTPFWVMLAVGGSYEMRFFMPLAWRRTWTVVAPAGFILAMLGLALMDDVVQWKSIIQNAEPLATVNTPATRHTYKYAEAHKGVTYIVEEEHPHLSAWFAYASRGAKTYLGSSNYISDLLPVPWLEPYIVIPPGLKNAVALTRSGVVPLDGLDVPVLKVLDPVGERVDEQGVPFYWLGFEPTKIDAFVPASSGASSEWNIHVEVAPFFPYLDPESGISITAEDGSVQNLRFDKKCELQFPVTLHGGVDHLRLQAIRPTEATNHVSDDPRRGTIYLQKVFATPRN